MVSILKPVLDITLYKLDLKLAFWLDVEVCVLAPHPLCTMLSLNNSCAVCRVDQDVCYRICDVSWQILNSQADWIIMSPDTTSFHPTFGISQKRQTKAQDKIAAMEPGPTKDAEQQFFNDGVAAASDSWKAYIASCKGKRTYKSDLKATCAVARALGVSQLKILRVYSEIRVQVLN